MAVTTAQVNALMSRYVKNYESKYGNKPEGFNRYREKWGFIGMIEDLGLTRANEVVDYYFETNNLLHPVQTLLYEYDRLSTIMKERAKDDENRERLRRESEARVKQWREAHGK